MGHGLRAREKERKKGEREEERREGGKRSIRAKLSIDALFIMAKYWKRLPRASQEKG